MIKGPYEEGVDAAVKGNKEDDNPYPTDSAEGKDWWRGFSSISGPVDPFKEGVDAFGRGDDESDCPYPANTDAREQWVDGWQEAKHYGTDDEVKDNF